MKALRNAVAESKFGGTRTRTMRAGISLLEILISIGVVGIGLIGVAALIPLAHHKANEGINTDRMASVGRRAFREFKVRGFDRPGILNVNHLWSGANFVNTGGVDFSQVYFSRNDFYHPIDDERNPSLLPYLPTVPPMPIPNRRPAHIIKQTYCFDPIGVADRFRVYQQFSGNTGNMPLANRFPAVAIDVATNFQTEPLPAGLISVPRITVLSQRSDGGSLAPLMPLAQAFEVCSVRDDLEFAIPSDNETLPRTQQMLFADMDGDGTKESPVRRLNEGNFSWMATMVPETRTIFNGAGFPVTTFAQDSDNYTVSIVVFQRRTLFSNLLPLGTPDVTLASNQFNQEIVGRVLPPGEAQSFTSYSGEMTKEVHIRPSYEFDKSKEWIPGNRSAGVAWSDVKIGDWVCLYQIAGGQQNPVASNAILKWFQVISAEIPDNAGTYDEVLLSLKGPDWTFYSTNADGGPIPNGDSVSLYHTYAFYVAGVETVYEKTVRLKTTSSYAQ